MPSRVPIECPGCGEMVASIDGKPMMHYQKGSELQCDMKPPLCRQCHQPAINVQDLASVRSDGVCHACHAAD